MVFLEGRRDGYSVDQSGDTMTVRELIDFLESNFSSGDLIYLRNDGGYTYGSITEDSFEER